MSETVSPDPAEREAALRQALALIRRHELTLDELRAALAPPQRARAQSGVLPRVFAWIGGIFVFIGLVTFVGMRWEALGAASRVLLTLGAGFCVFISALFCSFDARTVRVASPLFLIAALLQPTGILVALEEYGRGGDPVLGLLFMYGLMFVQQGSALIRLQHTLLAFTTLVFGTGFCVVAMDWLGVPPRLFAMTLGLSLGCIGWGADRSRHAALAPLLYFIGALAFLIASHSWLDDSSAEGVFPGLAAGTIWLSTLARSRALLAVGTLALCAYLGDFMWEHFRDNLNAPLILILLGFVLIGLGMMAVKIHRRFISQPASG